MYSVNWNGLERTFGELDAALSFAEGLENAGYGSDVWSTKDGTLEIVKSTIYNYFTGEFEYWKP